MNYYNKKNSSTWCVVSRSAVGQTKNSCDTILNEEEDDDKKYFTVKIQIEVLVST